MNNKTTNSNPMMAVIKKKDRNVGVSLAVSDHRAEINYIEVSSILPYKNQARRTFDDNSLQDLAESVRSQGIIQPLQLIYSEDKAGFFEVVSGERRLRAAKLVGLEKVPCILLDKGKDADFIAIIENIQREDLHPLELADAYSSILSHHPGLRQKDLAVKLGISPAGLNEYIKVSSLPEHVKKHYIESGEGSLSFFINLVRKKTPDEIDLLVKHNKTLKRESSVVISIRDLGGEFKVDFRRAKGLSPDRINQLREELVKLSQYL